VPGVEQVPGGRVGARLLIDRHQFRRSLGVTVDADERDIVGQVVKRVVGRLDGGDHDKAGDPLIEMAADRVRYGLVIERADALDVDGKTVPQRRFRQCAERRRGAVERRGLRYHADYLRRSGDKDPGGPVRTVAELGDRGLHPHARLLPDVGMIVQDARDGLVGDARQFGDVCHRRLTGRSDQRTSPLDC
jgi:hypothetical protein